MNFSDYGIQISGQGEVDAICPKCSHTRTKKRDKCLAVNTEKETWLCHHCGWSGGLNRNEEYTPVKPSEYTYQKPAFQKTDLPEKAVKYFNNRGISAKTLDECQISYTQKYLPGVGREVSVIQFPYFRDGQIINIKSRDGEKHFCMEKGAERILYGYDDINDFTTIIVEGEIDKLSFWEAGFQNCISVPDGAPAANASNYSTKFEFLTAAEERLSAVHKFVVAVDSDEPGSMLQKELIRRLGAWRCWTVAWPDGCKDANDALRIHGPEALRYVVNEAQPVPVVGIYQVNDFKNKIVDAYHYGFKPGVKTGWSTVDNYYSVRPGEMTVVTGIPSSGKSEWLDALMVNIAKHEGWTFGILSMENLPLERHFGKLAEKYINLPFANSMKLSAMDEGQLEAAISWANRQFNFLLPNDDCLKVDDILELAKTLVYRQGISGLIIDPWNELDHSRGAKITEAEHISQCLGKIRRFAREHEVHVWIVAHPTKLQKDKYGNYPVPTPYDISGAAHWRNKADNCIAVHRPNVGNKHNRSVEVHIQKIRFKEIGRPGKVILEYDLDTGNYNQEAL